MNIIVALNGSKLAWEAAEDQHVLKIMTPNVAERGQRSMSVAAAATEPLYKYFQSKGLKVELTYDDLISQAKMTYWKRALIMGIPEHSSLSIERFISEVGIELRPIQKTALNKISKAAFSINASICGTGKTLTTLLNSFYFHKCGRRTLTIIVCPVSCMSEYKKEIQKYRGHFEDFSIEEIYGSSVNEMRRKLASAASDVLVLSLNSIEKLAADIQDKISNFDGQVIFVVEEGHYVKEVSSGRSLGAQAVAPLATRVIVNTATPMPKGPKDIRGILTLVGLPQPPEEYGHGIPARDFSIMEGVTFVSDEQDIPYGELRTEHLDYMDLHELNTKMVEVVEKELKNNKVIVFCSTNKGLENVWASFPNVNKTVLSGSFFVEDCTEKELKNGRSFENQQLAIKQFNSDERCRLLIANYRVGSTGVNLQHSGARLAFFFEISNNGADFFQARYRLRRPYIFPEDGFVYYFARSTDLRKRNTEDRQFAKIANQQSVLSDIKRHTRIGL